MMDSYDTILNRMVNDYQTTTGRALHEESDVMLRLRLLAGEVYRLRTSADFVLRQIFPTTAVGEYLDRHAAQRGLERKPAAKARVYLYFYRADGAEGAITIPEGTQVCTYNTSKRFVTVEETTIAASSSRAGVTVEAVEEGASYNVLGGTITVIVTPIAGVGRVYNGTLATGGADVESDDELRERVLDSYRHISNGTNIPYYKSLAMSVGGVSSAGVIGRVRGNGTVNVYVCGDATPVSAAVLAEVQSLLDQGRELNVSAIAYNASMIEINLQILLSVEDGYEFDDVADEVREKVERYIESLGIGSDMLLSNVGEVIHHIDGVADYRFVESYGTDEHLTQSQYPAPNRILIQEAS